MFDNRGLLSVKKGVSENITQIYSVQQVARNKLCFLVR